MSMPTAGPLPPLRELGMDLLRSSPWEKMVSVARPFLCLALFAVASLAEWWPLALLAMAALMFITYASTSHDYVHRTLRLPTWLNELLLALTEGLCLRSGHAFRLTHLHHHRRFPHDDDIEATHAMESFGAALLAGPGHQTRLFLWAWRQARATERLWLLSEAIFVAALLFGAVALLPLTPIPAIYAVLAVGGAWFYPLATVWWPHRRPGTHALAHTRRMRGRWVPAIFLQHTYHLEHHLYPSVPAHNWAKLARRLDPYLDAAGVTVRRLP